MGSHKNKNLIICALSAILVHTSVPQKSYAATSDIYYCISQNFVGAKANEIKNYKEVRFTMKLERNTPNSDTGTVTFSDGHPEGGHAYLLDADGFKHGWHTNFDTGFMSFTFYSSAGQLYQAWVTPDQAIALSAKCETF